MLHWTHIRIPVVAAMATGSLAYDVTSLTPDNYDSLTAGKTVFLKFFAPWVSWLYLEKDSLKQ